EARGGLVEHDHLRVGDLGHRHLELALLAVRERADEGVDGAAEGDALGGDARAVEELPVARPPEEAKAPAPLAAEREVEVVEHAEPREEARLLVAAREPERRPDPRGK